MNKLLVPPPYESLEAGALRDLALRIVADPKSPEVHVQKARARLRASITPQRTMEELIAQLPADTVARMLGVLDEIDQHDPLTRK